MIKVEQVKVGHFEVFIDDKDLTMLSQIADYLHFPHKEIVRGAIVALLVFYDLNKIIERSQDGLEG